MENQDSVGRENNVPIFWRHTSTINASRRVEVCNSLFLTSHYAEGTRSSLAHLRYPLLSNLEEPIYNALTVLSPNIQKHVPIISRPFGRL